MSQGLMVFECRACGKTVFPRRLLCPGCGASKWTRHRVDRGKLTDSTTLRRFAGHEALVRLGSVEIVPALIVIARLSTEIPPISTEIGLGSSVTLSSDGGVPVAEELP